MLPFQSGICSICITDRRKGALIFSWKCEEEEARVVNSRVVLCRQLHAFSVRAAVDANVFVGTAFLDVYARSGLIEESSCILKAVSFCVAHELMKRMPFVATASMWGSHLVSCRIHGNLELAEIAAKNLFEMEP
ncbi:hypothetical protein D5086_015561 [Populus alba]|uniref:Uncharacterized protein n=1 Tax=Populus alba TaxID=43335 RepID=A0ACC4BT22_POPAL